jgi:23S rRNA pseudouridine1911/1915/1917 synthase
VPVTAAGARIDAYLASVLPLSRSRIEQLIGDGRVTLDGTAAKKSARLRGGEAVEVREPPPVSAELVAEDIPLDVLYEDNDLLVIDKAAGMAVHPGAGIASGTVANAVRARCPHVKIGGELRPGIVHRLDKDTSGVLVVCKNESSLDVMARAFAERRVQKRYRAWCLGDPSTTRGSQFELRTGHRRAEGDRRRFTTRVPETVGRVAHSRFVVRATRDGASALDVELLTGRTHQIRAHLADIGHPLLQDELYGGAHAERRLRLGPLRDAVAALTRQALHASQIAFEHPRTQKEMHFEAPLPIDLARIDVALAGVNPFARVRR